MRDVDRENGRIDRSLNPTPVAINTFRSVWHPLELAAATSSKRGDVWRSPLAGVGKEWNPDRKMVPRVPCSVCLLW